MAEVWIAGLAVAFLMVLLARSTGRPRKAADGGDGGASLSGGSDCDGGSSADGGCGGDGGGGGD